ncbi:MAG: tRNA (adenosine(37)-N6)-threonylcarbamoyltransferase complex ATPase subunit type 1 TsaE [Prevotellaceae bacterium]|jgi:tRNA threonylcarbamoyladenosine biosynthesis protein TsaE|nr:tRNA (adenosine(37)-N6)-threonylcarbamoyltransferase complex ATPase subunit type 1 TsaE [Prevotellaceae bacterium]
MLSIEIPDLTGLADAVKVLLNVAGDRHIIAFYGKMGAGKTTVIKEICRQLNVTDVVNSPTFALVNEYRRAAGGSVFHFDFYRINKIDEVYDLGYEEYFYGNNLCLVEWSEKIEQLLPDDAFAVKIEETDNGKRIITIET